jgi:magnesium transporter
MLRLLKPSKRVSLPAGTLEPTPKPAAEEVTISVIDYDEEQVQEKQVETVDECFPFKDRPTVTRINVNGIHDVGITQKLGAHFAPHPLVLEDIMHISASSMPVRLVQVNPRTEEDGIPWVCCIAGRSR